MAAFARRIDPRFVAAPFHEVYYQLLTRFARGEIRRLMVSVPPQHGKSYGASQLLPAWLLGLDPDRRITIASYSFALARRFGLAVQRLIEEPAYQALFPDTQLKGMEGSSKRASRTALRTAQGFDCVGRDGGLLAVGRAGSLTGHRVDVMILDDLYKNLQEAHSPLIRENTWEWYQAVVRTRLHNDSQELVVSTRWHEEDLIGRLKATEPVVELTDWSQLAGLSPESWVAVNFEAVKQSPSSMLDPRSEGEALWPERHDLRLLARKRTTDPVIFEALYQGNPTAREGLLYGEFATYLHLPARVVHRANYTDTADTGSDRLCSICYAVGATGEIYLVDVLYTDAPMEVTETRVAEQLLRNDTRIALIESNNGGRGFARAVARKAPHCSVRTLHQSANKESRILTNAPTVTQTLRMPHDWRMRWPEFAADVSGYRRLFASNRHHDAPDALTGVIEQELYGNPKRIRQIHFTE